MDSARTDMRTIGQWAKEYNDQNGVNLNLGTLRKRRLVCGHGVCIPPHTWLLTWEEFIDVVNTPLPDSHRVLLK